MREADEYAGLEIREMSFNTGRRRVSTAIDHEGRADRSRSLDVFW